MVEFKELYKTNVNEYVEKVKQNNIELSYLSWSYAWMKIRELYPTAAYEVKMFDNKPYIYDENLGYMVFTSMTIEEEKHDMWLPVMNSANKAMKNKPYEYSTKQGVKQVEAATMFDINKTIMRCLAKNIAMFGLGLYIYNGEDVPKVEEEPTSNENKQDKQLQVKSENVSTQAEISQFKSKEDLIDDYNFLRDKLYKLGIDITEEKCATWLKKNAKVEEIEVDLLSIVEILSLNQAMLGLIDKYEAKRKDKNN